MLNYYYNYKNYDMIELKEKYNFVFHGQVCNLVIFCWVNHNLFDISLLIKSD